MSENDKEISVEELTKMISEINQAPSSWECFKKLGCLNPNEKEKYKEKYEYFVYTNGKRI